MSVCDKCFTKLELAKLVSRKILGKVGVGRGGGRSMLSNPTCSLIMGSFLVIGTEEGDLCEQRTTSF